MKKETTLNYIGEQVMEVLGSRGYPLAYLKGWRAELLAAGPSKLESLMYSVKRLDSANLNLLAGRLGCDVQDLAAARRLVAYI